jgi:hypothetical protein
LRQYGISGQSDGEDTGCQNKIKALVFKKILEFIGPAFSKKVLFHMNENTSVFIIPFLQGFIPEVLKFSIFFAKHRQT